MASERSDRRSHERFEVVGELWGYVTVPTPLRIVNVSADGVLARSTTPLDVGSIHAVSAVAGGEVDEVRLRVTHARPGPEGEGDTWVGLECVDEDRGFWEQVVVDLAGDDHGDAR